jgi:hypothetical protein
MSDQSIIFFAARLDALAVRTLILCLPGAAALRNRDLTSCSALAAALRGVVQDVGRVTLKRVEPVAA